MVGSGVDEMRDEHLAHIGAQPREDVALAAFDPQRLVPGDDRNVVEIVGRRR